MTEIFPQHRVVGVRKVIPNPRNEYVGAADLLDAPSRKRRGA